MAEAKADIVTTVREGYAFDGPCVELGALVVDGAPRAEAKVRVQHQLRAFTPNDADALKATVRTYPTSSYDLEALLQALGIGEGVVTVMSEKGAPTPVAHAMMPAPQSLMAPSDPSVLSEIVTASALAPLYSEPIDRESAYERLTGKIAAGPGAPVQPPLPHPGTTDAERLEAEILGIPPQQPAPGPPPAPTPPAGPAAPKTRKPRARKAQPTGGGIIDNVLGSSAFESFLKSAGAALGREISRGMLGNRRRR